MWAIRVVYLVRSCWISRVESCDKVVRCEQCLGYRWSQVSCPQGITSTPGKHQTCRWRCGVVSTLQAPGVLPCVTARSSALADIAAPMLCCRAIRQDKIEPHPTMQSSCFVPVPFALHCVSLSLSRPGLPTLFSCLLVRCTVHRSVASPLPICTELSKGEPEAEPRRWARKGRRRASRRKVEQHSEGRRRKLHLDTTAGRKTLAIVVRLLFTLLGDCADVRL